MLVWLTLPFYDFCGFRSVAVNSVYKLQFFYIYLSRTPTCDRHTDERMDRQTHDDGKYRASIASHG